MRNLFRRICLCAIVFLLATGQAAAFDIQIGHLNFGPPAAATASRYQTEGNGVGAMLSIPFGLSNSSKPTTNTLNGQALAQFTEQDAKDSLIVIMLFGVAIAAGVLTVSAASN